MSNKSIISKDKYMDVLEQQRQYLENKVTIAKEDLSTLEFAIEDLLEKEFEQVEVIEKDGTFSFNIVENNND